MILEDKVLVFDIDGTICPTKRSDQSYSDLEPLPEMINKINAYKKEGFNIVFYTARNMRTHQGNIGKMNANTLKDLMEWMDKHEIHYDEIHIGKPWPGKNGFYVDDRCIRPDEFLSKSYEEIRELTGLTNA
jgi:capsule biosynthesis phosphatase